MATRVALQRSWLISFLTSTKAPYRAMSIPSHCFLTNFTTPLLSLVCGTHRPCWFTTAIQITRWKNQGVEREFEADGGILKNYSGNWKSGEGGGKRALEEAGRYSTNPPCAHHMFTIYSPLTHQHHPYVRKVFH